MPLNKKIYGAEILLNFVLDPPADEWMLVAGGKEGFSRETYKSAGYVIDTEEQRKPNYTVVGFNLKREDGRSFTVKKYVLTAHTYMHDIYRTWIPDYLDRSLEFMYLIRSVPWFNAKPFWIVDSRSSAHLRIPIIMGLNRKGIVTLGVGFVDQRVETDISVRGATHNRTEDLEKGMFIFQLKRPLEGYSIGPVTEFKDAYFVGKGSFWFDTMQEYSRIHAKKMNRPVKPSPDPCWEPLWAPWAGKPGKWGTTWIEEMDEELLLKAMEIGQRLGIRTICNMGSWFITTVNIGMWYPMQCGDYLPDTKKFPDFRGFVRKLHKMNVMLMLWIDAFAIGKDTKIREKIKDALIDIDMPRSDPRYREVTSLLCPRNPKAQKHIAETMARVLRDFEADGYTVDCINNVPLEPCTANHEHNFSSIGIAMDYCFAKMKEAMDRVKPDAIIEWRQQYANINNLNYATAFRAQDSGDTGDYELNRRLCVFLRSYVPSGVAVHTDPMWWRIDEDDKTVAKMLSTMIVSGVPQLAPDLINIPDSHRELIKEWLGFYQQHKEDFRYGQMRPIQSDPQFSTILISSPGKAFISYGNYPALKIPLTKDVNEIYLFNCTLEDSLYTILQGVEGEYRAELYDHTLTSIGEAKVTAKNREALVDLNIPQGGYSVMKKT